MRVLALDTALTACGVAVLDGPRLTADMAEIGKGHAEYLMPQIARVTDAAGIGLADLDRIVVAIGPGSFTGIRAGLAAARGFGLALGLPVIGVTTLDILAADMRDWTDGPVMAALDARRDEVYAQVFAADGVALTPPQALAIAEAAHLATQTGAAVAGSGAALVRAVAPEVPLAGTPAQGTVATLARIGATRTPGAAPPGPLYLRAADAKPQAGYALARAARANAEERP